MVDLLLKSWAFSHFEAVDTSLISLHQNSGTFLGLLKETNPLIRIVTLSSFLGFLYTIIYFFQYLVVGTVPFLTSGLTLFLAGITGNVADRAYYGYVRDYIHIFSENSFNLADVYIVFGFILIVVSIFKYGEILWYPNTGRKFKFVFSEEQIVFSSKIIAVLFFYFLIVLFFCISFFTAYDLPRHIYTAFVVGLLFLSLLFSLIIFFISCILFERITGPLVALEKFLDDLESGNERNLVLRKNDYFKNIENISIKIKRLNNKRKDT